MKDPKQDLTQEQLAQELAEYRRRIAELEQAELHRKKTEELMVKANAELEMRVRELTSNLFQSREHLEKEILERKRIEGAFRETEEKFRAVVETSWEGVCIVQDGRLVFVNQTTARFLGFSESEMLGMEFTDFVHPEDRDQLYQRYSAQLKGERLPSRFTLRVVTKSGETRWLDAGSTVTLWCGKPSFSFFATDTTDRKRAEDELSQSAERYRALVEESFDGIFVQKGTKIMFANSRLHEMLGYDRGELEGLDHWMVYHPDYQGLTRERAQARMRGEEVPSQYEVRLQRKDGSSFEGEINAKAIRFNDEPGVQVWVRDISERKQAEQALRESEERFRRLSDAAEEGIAIHDHGIIIDANAALARMFGYELPELIGASAEKLTTPDSLKTILKNIASGHDKPYEAVGLRKDGSTFLARLVGKPYQYRGRTVRLVSFTDITEQKKAEEELRKSEEKYRTILETIADGYHEVDLHGNLTLVNDSLRDSIGYSREELLNMNYRQLMDERSAHAVSAAYNKVYEKGEAIPEFGWEAIRKDGTKISVSASISLVRDPQGHPVGFRGILRDVTDRKRLEEQLQQAARMEAIGRLAGGVAHDFNNLLTAVMGYTNLLIESMPKDSAVQDKLVRIIRSAERAAALTRQLLAFGRKQVLDIKALNLNQVIEDLEEMLRRLIGEDIELATVFDPSAGTVEADPGQIEQILMNLVVNARDAMPNGGKLTIETQNAFLDEEYAQSHADVAVGRYVMFAVSDSGAGMDTATLKRIFDPFFTTKEKDVGTGLGLSTVYGIAKQHRGHIGVYSEPGRGTTFKIYLPRADAPAEPIEARPVLEPYPRGRETVLVVEDEDIVRDLACEVLTMLGYVPLAACNPLEAKSICRDHEGAIHLFLTDVVLPQMDGRSLFESVSSIRPEMRVLYVSGYTENFIVHHGVLDKDVHFMQKPFTVEALARKVREVLDEQ